MSENDMKAGRPCTRCGGQVLPQWDIDANGTTVELEYVCQQCGRRPDTPHPRPEDVAKLEKHPEPRIANSSLNPEFFRCKRPGCKEWKVRTRNEVMYCSRSCWYQHRTEMGVQRGTPIGYLSKRRRQGT